jgi:hypothetical protein
MFILIQSGDGDWTRNFVPAWRQAGLRDEGRHALMAYDTFQELCPKRTGSFSFGGISPPNEKVFLCVLSASAVKMLFWTGMG